MDLRPKRYWYDGGGVLKTTYRDRAGEAVCVRVNGWERERERDLKG